MSLKKAMPEMYDETCLELRGSVYWFRMRVATDLRDELGKNEIRHSLKTKDKREAKRLAADRKAALLAEWHVLREKLKRGPRRSITKEEIDRIASHASAHLLQFDEDERMRGRPLDPDAVPEYGFIEQRESMMDRARRAIGAGQYSESLRTAAEDWLRHYGFELDPASDDYLQFIFALAQRGRKDVDALRQRNNGDIVETPPVPRPESPGDVKPGSRVQDKRHQLSELIPIWKRLKNPAPSSEEIYDLAVRRFQEAHEGISVEGITKSHVRQHIKRMQEAGKSAKTIEKEHGALRALLTVAEHEEWITSNPAKGILLPNGKKSDKRSYTPAEVERILASEVFTRGVRPVGGKGEAAYWIPLLLLFTGARREEICQLTVDHVRVADGAHYLAIDPRGDDGRLKTDESRRSVPLHPELLRVGFLRYVDQRRKEGGGRVFPLLQANKRGQVGAKWGDWWCRYVRQKVGITDPDLQPAHGFRHLFITECRRLNFREDYERALVGHTGSARSDSHNDYGEHLVSTLAAYVAKIDFRGVSFSHLRR